MATETNLRAGARQTERDKDIAPLNAKVKIQSFDKRPHLAPDEKLIHTG
jgi:hypothetical protein